MGLYANRPDRVAIPRWRDFKKTSAGGELLKQKNNNTPLVPVLTISRQLENWTKEKSIIHAIELVNAAFVTGICQPAEEAAAFLLVSCDASHPIRRIVERVLNKTTSTADETKEVIFDSFHIRIGTKIREIRTRLKGNPNNAVLWLDLARWNTVLGKVDRAELCVKTAIQIAPSNPFVLRCAVRFFIHIHSHDGGKKDSLNYALQLIRKNPTTKSDPWLLATEIALCTFLKKTSNLMKIGTNMIGDKNFSPFMLSELNAVIATEELSHGNSRLSKKLFTSALVDPNENSVAQADWATGYLGDLPINLTKQNSFEASSYQHYNHADWEQSFEDALKWVVDEPFSSQPAGRASFLAGAVIDDNEMAIKICDFGLRANPHDFGLLNNKAYSLAVEKKGEEAEKIFKMINVNALSEKERITYLATKGLVFYSKGDAATGGFYYDSAEALARKSRDVHSATRVRIYKTRAQFTFGFGEVDAATAIMLLRKENQLLKEPDIERTIDILSRRLGVEGEANKPNSDTFVLSLRK